MGHCPPGDYGSRNNHVSVGNRGSATSLAQRCHDSVAKSTIANGRDFSTREVVMIATEQMSAPEPALGGCSCCDSCSGPSCGCCSSC